MGGIGFPGQGLGQGNARLAHLLGAAIELAPQPLAGTQTQALLLSDQGEEVLAVAFQQGGEGRFTGERLGQGGQVLFELGTIADVAAQHEVLLIPAQLQHQQALLLLAPGLELLLQRVDGLTQGAVMAAGRGEPYLLLLGAQGLELAAVLLELAGKGQDVGLLRAPMVSCHLGEQLTGLVTLGNEGGGGSGYSYYTIKATAGAGGSISPSGNVSVREGRDQTFTITPDKGYAVANVKIDGKSIGAVKSYTFENVSRTHTIEVIFMKANGNPQTGVFVDVATGSYYEDAVDWAVLFSLQETNQ